MTQATLATALEEYAALLSTSGWSEQAAWLRARAARVARGDARDAVEAAEEVLARLAGMGSLSDLPLRPSAGESARELGIRQWDLIERIDSLARLITATN